MIYVVNLNNKEYEVEVEKDQAILLKTTDVATKALDINSAASNSHLTQVPAPAAPLNNAAGECVNSPMPGTILDIKVKVGDMVKNGQILMILEAMKMENEIFAPSNGVVTQIAVIKGATVATNDVLIKIQ